MRTSIAVLIIVTMSAVLGCTQTPEPVYVTATTHPIVATETAEARAETERQMQVDIRAAVAALVPTPEPASFIQTKVAEALATTQPTETPQGGKASLFGTQTPPQEPVATPPPGVVINTMNEQSENENEDRDTSMETEPKSWYSTCLARTWRAISLDTSVGTAVLLMAACAYPTRLDQMSCTDVGHQLTDPDEYLPGLEIEGFESLELSDRTDASISCNGLAETSEGPKQLTIRLHRPSVRDQYTIIVNNPDGSGVGLVYRGSLEARPRWGDPTSVPTIVPMATAAPQGPQATRMPPGTHR